MPDTGIKMKVSVIIPTYNGAHKIKNVLNSVENQTMEPDEVIVVIDGSTDNTSALLASSSFSIKHLRIIEQENGGRAKVRNVGAKQATGELLIFFDDDMRPDPECIRMHVRHHQQYPGSILTGGLMEEVLSDTPDFVRFKASLSKKWNRPYGNTHTLIETKDKIYLSAANFSIPKSLFDALGGFDERLTDAEDYDLGFRAFMNGIPLHVNPEAHAWHNDPVTCRKYIARMREYRIAHKKLAELKSYNAADVPKGIKGKIFSMFCTSFWIKSVDNGYWRWLLPRPLRYRLYDLIITANGTYFPEKVKL